MKEEVLGPEATRTITHHTSLTSHHIHSAKKIHITHHSHLITSLSEEVLSPEARRTITHHTSHITHITPHHSAKKFLGLKRGELSHITHHSHLTTSLSEEVLGPEARRIITHHTSLTSQHITQRRSSRAGSDEYYTSHITHISPHH